MDLIAVFLALENRVPFPRAEEREAIDINAGGERRRICKVEIISGYLEVAAAARCVCGKSGRGSLFLFPFFCIAEKQIVLVATL